VHESKIIKLKISPAPAVEVLTEENESITQRINPIDVPTPIDPIEKEKLETFVNKTIDDSNVLEIPLVDDEKDEYTEEVEKKIDSTEGITNDYESKLTTHQIQHQPDDYEVETSTFTTKLTTPITTLATIIEEIEYDSNSNTVMMTSPPNQETETVFLTPTIFENINNEVINNNLERLSIETETTTITPASSTSYTNKVFEESLMTTTSTVSYKKSTHDAGAENFNFNFILVMRTENSKRIPMKFPSLIFGFSFCIFFLSIMI
jgi:hypothetical protein